MQKTKTIHVKRAVIVEPPNVLVTDPGYNSPGNVRFSKDRETILFGTTRMSRLRSSLAEMIEVLELEPCKTEFIGISMAKLYTAARRARKAAGFPDNIIRSDFFRFLFHDMQHLWSNRMRDKASDTHYFDGLEVSGIRGLSKRIYYLEYKAEASGNPVMLNAEIIYDVEGALLSALHCVFYDYVASRRRNSPPGRTAISREHSQSIAGCVLMYELMGKELPDLTPKKIDAKSSGPITVGCDPEFLITEKNSATKELLVNREQMSAEDVFDGVMLGCDGHAETAELRPSFSANPSVVTNCIEGLIKKAAVRIPEHMAIEVGGGFRDSIGGHIHLGNEVLRRLSSVGALKPLTNILDEFLYYPMKTSMAGGTRCWSELNIFNGEPSFDLEDSPGFKRNNSSPQEMITAVKGARVGKGVSFAEYEIPSALRTKNWGIEYRSLPSFIADKRLTYLTLKLSQRIARWFLGASENGEDFKFSMPPSKEDYMKFLTEREASDLLEYFYGEKRHIFVMDAREGWGASPYAKIRSIFHVLGQNYFSEHHFFPIREEIDILAQVDAKRWHKLFEDARVPGIQILVQHGNGTIPSRFATDQMICNGFIVKGNTLWYHKEGKQDSARARIMHKLGASCLLGRFGDVRHPDYSATAAIILGKDNGRDDMWMKRNLGMVFFALGISVDAIAKNEAQRKEGATLLSNIASRKNTVMDKDFMKYIKISRPVVEKEVVEVAQDTPESPSDMTSARINAMWDATSVNRDATFATDTSPFEPLTSEPMRGRCDSDDYDDEDPCMCDECRYDRGEIDADGDEI